MFASRMAFPLFVTLWMTWDTAVPLMQTDSAPELTRQEMEDFLRTAAVIRERPAGGGVTNSIRATLSGGGLTHDAHVQTVDFHRWIYRGQRGTEYNFRDCYKFNVAAYRLDKMLELNMVPVCVQRQWKRKESAVSWWVDEVAMDESERRKKKIDPPDRRAWARQMSAVGVFDALIFNTDRHRKNLLISKDWRVWLIDHTRAFRRNVTIPRPEALKKVDRKLLQRLCELSDDQLRGELGTFLKEVEIKALLVRRDRIIEHFEKRIREAGEEAVLY